MTVLMGCESAKDRMKMKTENEDPRVSRGE